MGEDIFRVQGSDAHPVFHGFVNIALVEEQFSGASGCLDGFLQAPGAFQ
jgi:hypothetical protein